MIHRMGPLFSPFQKLFTERLTGMGLTLSLGSISTIVSVRKGMMESRRINRLNCRCSATQPPSTAARMPVP